MTAVLAQLGIQLANPGNPGKVSVFLFSTSKVSTSHRWLRNWDEARRDKAVLCKAPRVYEMEVFRVFQSHMKSTLGVEPKEQF